MCKSKCPCPKPKCYSKGFITSSSSFFDPGRSTTTTIIRQTIYRRIDVIRINRDNRDQNSSISSRFINQRLINNGNRCSCNN